MSVNVLTRSGSISNSLPTESKGFFSRMKRCCNSSVLPQTLAVGGLTLGSVALVGAGILAALGAALLVTASVATLAIPLLIVGGVALLGGGVIMAIRAYQSSKDSRSKTSTTAAQLQAVSTADETPATGNANKGFNDDDENAGSPSRKVNLSPPPEQGSQHEVVEEEVLVASVAPAFLHASEGGSNTGSNGNVN